MIRIALAFVLALTLALPALACPSVGAGLAPGSCGVANGLGSQSYGGQGIASAQSFSQQSYQQSYVQPQAAIVQPYATSNLRVIQRNVIPQAVYVQPAQTIVQHQITTPYVQQSLFQQSGIGYGVGMNVGVSNGLVGGGIGRGLFGGGSTRTVTKTVTKTGRGGLINRILGR